VAETVALAANVVARFVLGGFVLTTLHNVYVLVAGAVLGGPAAFVRECRWQAARDMPSSC
jgi:hypothetical protein